MKLKLVVVSMSVLGLISTSAIAAETATETTHKHHHNVVAKQHVAHHRHTVRQEIEEMGGTMPVPCASTPCVVTNPCSALILSEMTQNLGRAYPCPDWFNRIGVSGGINFDFGKWVNHRGNFQGENYQHFSLNDAYLNVSAGITDWSRAFASLSYSNPTETGFINSNNFGYSNVYAVNRLSLEQAYFTIGNFDCSPLFLQFGKQFNDFSRYEIHPITRSMTQVLSEALSTQAKIGFLVPMGFHGAIYAFDDPLNNSHGHNNFYSSTNYYSNSNYHRDSSRHVDWGVSLGYDHPCDCLGYGLGVGYVNSMTAAQDVAHAVSNFTNSSSLHKRVGAMAFYGDVNSGPFSLGLRYTTAMSRFDRRDLPNYRPFSFSGLSLNNAFLSPTYPTRHHSGAKPWAAGIQAAYTYNAWCKNQNLFLGYQTSKQAAGIGLPKTRWLAGYGIDLCKNTGFGLEWDHDTAYGNGRRSRTNFFNTRRHQNTNRTSDLVSLRADVKFG